MTGLLGVVTAKHIILKIKIERLLLINRLVSLYPEKTCVDTALTKLNRFAIKLDSYDKELAFSLLPNNFKSKAFFTHLSMNYIGNLHDIEVK